MNLQSLRHRVKVARLSASLVIVAAICGLPASVAAQSEAVEYYGQDALGSIRIVFDASGNVLGRTDYGPFGDVVVATSSGNQKNVYAGLFRDSETDQDYAQARMYQHRTGRFTRVDPIYSGLFEPQRWNRYSYGLNNPLVYVDADGLTPCPTDYCEVVVGHAPDRPWPGDLGKCPGGSCGAGGLPGVPGGGAGDPPSGYPGRGGPPGDTDDPDQGTTPPTDTPPTDPNPGPNPGPPPGPPPPGPTWRQRSQIRLQAYLKFCEQNPGARECQMKMGVVAPPSFVIGRVGEAFIRARYAIGPATSIIVNGRARIVDGMLGSIISEVKNVGYQGWTTQLRDYSAASAGQLDLYVRNSTVLSRALKAAERAGLVNIIRGMPW